MLAETVREILTPVDATADAPWQLPAPWDAALKTQHRAVAFASFLLGELQAATTESQHDWRALVEAQEAFTAAAAELLRSDRIAWPWTVAKSPHAPREASRPRAPARKPRRRQSSE